MKKFAEEDKAKRELIEEKNRAEGGILQMEQQIEEFKDQLSEEKIKELNEEMDKMRTMLGEDGVTAETLREKWQELQKVQMETFKEAYQKKMNENQGASSEEPKEEKKE